MPIYTHARRFQNVRVLDYTVIRAFKNAKIGARWWSSGQRARLLLWRSEFESRSSLQFISIKFVFDANENKQKEAGVGPYKKIMQKWRKNFSVLQICAVTIEFTLPEIFLQ